MDEAVHHLHLMLKSRMVELYLHSLMCLHGAMLNYLAQGKLYPFFTFTFGFSKNCHWSFHYTLIMLTLVVFDALLADEKSHDSCAICVVLAMKISAFFLR
jgi:hypothetical protein